MNEINVGEGDKKAKRGLLLWREGCVTGPVSFLRYTLFSLLDTFLLGGVAHPQFTESVHQLIIGGVEFQRMEPGLAGL